METKIEKINQSVTLKFIVIGILTLLMLIPGIMIQNLILERETRSKETIRKINEKWGNAQTIAGPILVIPIKTKTVDEKKNVVYETLNYNLTPEQLIFRTKLIPEERHYGIYKSILYKSETFFSGKFVNVASVPIKGEIQWKDASIRLGISDLHGVSSDMDFAVNGVRFSTEACKDNVIGNGLEIFLKDGALDTSSKELNFTGKVELNGSSEINFVPVGKNTQVEVGGNWKSPSFIGNFSPEYTLDANGFTAKWSVLHFNRNIPEYWVDTHEPFTDSSFGVNLVDPVDHYQLNMRSAKYALMFIVLTFMVFVFVEILTKRRIHPIQYLLVGIALIIFYSLLLSISEQLNFGMAYLVSSIATISLITIYANSIFKNKKYSGILACILILLYVYLYVILQLEDVALLIGSIGLFVILGIIMFLSRKIKWYKKTEYSEEIEEAEE